MSRKKTGLLGRQQGPKVQIGEPEAIHPKGSKKPYMLVTMADDDDFHFAVYDEASRTIVATSSKPYGTERSAQLAGKRALNRKYAKEADSDRERSDINKAIGRLLR